VDIRPLGTNYDCNRFQKGFGARLDGLMARRKISPEIHHVVITGASSGIGAALARHYAKKGFCLSLLGRDEARTDAIAQECAAAGADLRAEIGDVTDSNFMTGWLERCDAREPVDVVIANAGVGGRFAMPEGVAETVAAARDIFMTNLVGVSNTILPILPRLAERRRGQLVLVSSLAGYLGLPDAPAYSASKAAVRIYGEALRRRVSRHGLGVSVVCPGFVQTPMSDSLPGALPLLWDSDSAARHIAGRIARGHHEIAFPWPLFMLTRIATMLPSTMLDSILARIRVDRESR
jgi:short-subunit dehydrogenase